MKRLTSDIVPGFTLTQKLKIVLCFGLALPHVLSCVIQFVIQSRSGTLCCSLGQHITLTVPLPTQRNMGTGKLLGLTKWPAMGHYLIQTPHSGDSNMPTRFMQQNPKELSASIKTPFINFNRIHTDFTYLSPLIYPSVEWRSVSFIAWKVIEEQGKLDWEVGEPHPLSSFLLLFKSLVSHSLGLLSFSSFLDCKNPLLFNLAKWIRLTLL